MGLTFESLRLFQPVYFIILFYGDGLQSLISIILAEVFKFVSSSLLKCCILASFTTVRFSSHFKVLIFNSHPASLEIRRTPGHLPAGLQIVQEGISRAYVYPSADSKSSQISLIHSQPMKPVDRTLAWS